MKKLFFLKCLGVACAASLSMIPLAGCGHKEVSLDKEKNVNFTLPEEGEDIVVLTIKDYGDVKIKLFPEETEKGVENFTTLVKKGFYDELIFHRVIKGFMIQGGDPKGDGTGGEDAWGSQTGFAQTISPSLAHFSGAVAYAIGQDKMNKSQFYIVTGDAVTEDSLKQIEQSYGTGFSNAVKDLYYQYGGAPHLDKGYEIFGQVFDGLEYCIAISEVPTAANDKPKTPVVIEKAVVVPYDGSAPDWMNYKGESVTSNASSESKEE